MTYKVFRGFMESKGLMEEIEKLFKDGTFQPPTEKEQLALNRHLSRFFKKLEDERSKDLIATENR